MAVTNELTDVAIELDTGHLIIDDETYDAKIIRGTDVVLQDAGIRVRTQVGTIKRQLLDGFGWNYIGRIKQKLSNKNINQFVSAVSKIILVDDRIDDAEVAVVQNPINDDLQISANLRIGEVSVPLTVTV